MQQQSISVSSLRLVIIAMMVGIVVLGAVVLAIGKGSAADPALKKLLPFAPLVLAVLELGAYFVLRSVTIASARRQNPQPLAPQDAKRAFTPAVLTIWLASAAMIEGVALFSLVAFLLTGVLWLLALPAAALILLALRFPSELKLEQAVRVASGQEHL
ncbi:MAG: hypothetical protein JXO22_10115 [Phycisphaerae bacterium]|nr:hypothetical protein [Phycisphaerae bacterium]